MSLTHFFRKKYAHRDVFFFFKEMMKKYKYCKLREFIERFQDKKKNNMIVKVIIITTGALNH